MCQCLSRRSFSPHPNLPFPPGSSTLDWRWEQCLTSFSQWCWHDSESQNWHSSCLPSHVHRLWSLYLGLVLFPFFFLSSPISLAKKALWEKPRFIPRRSRGAAGRSHMQGVSCIKWTHSDHCKSLFTHNKHQDIKHRGNNPLLITAVACNVLWKAGAACPSISAPNTSSAPWGFRAAQLLGLAPRAHRMGSNGQRWLRAVCR